MFHRIRETAKCTICGNCELESREYMLYKFPQRWTCRLHIITEYAGVLLITKEEQVKSIYILLYTNNAKTKSLLLK